jgi:predicted  nucleic acid-binding Zn-ribbon protein
MSRSSTGSVNSNSSYISHQQQYAQPTQFTSQKENENLEEDMRKAKESADLLKSVVLPLENEIKKLKNKIKDMENYIKNVTLEMGPVDLGGRRAVAVIDSI